MPLRAEAVPGELPSPAVHALEDQYAGSGSPASSTVDTVIACGSRSPSATADHIGHQQHLAQLTARWGTRYIRNGKTIWAEQPLEPASTAAVTDADSAAEG
ncbi:hypothetical protein [Streptomyces endophytica]|uniref:Uncharacterized protein n=1 Tax=Streptomyces endophytica TaxID=2991496 RepID=A0ABY6PHU2_9ACTN|nr:hypothetical protein [Streptomyces endophytica]UZJ33063.1 hypothetical protein OJ254_25720 [Streptomyces endophytica]